MSCTHQEVDMLLGGLPESWLVGAPCSQDPVRPAAMCTAHDTNPFGTNPFDTYRFRRGRFRREPRLRVACVACPPWISESRLTDASPRHSSGSTLVRTRALQDPRFTGPTLVRTRALPGAPHDAISHTASTLDGFLSFCPRAFYDLPSTSDPVFESASTRPDGPARWHWAAKQDGL